MTLRDQIVEMSNNRNGVTSAEVMDRFEMTKQTAGSHLGDLTKQGRLFRAHRGGLKLRWFANEQQCRAWLVGVATGDTAFTISTRYSQRRLPVAAPVNIKAPKVPFSERPIDRCDVKPTRIASASHDPRFQCGPKDKIPPVFSKLDPGKYDTPASTWVIAATSRSRA